MHLVLTVCIYNAQPQLAWLNLEKPKCMIYLTVEYHTIQVKCLL